MTVQTKRAYEPPERADGYRVLVDRVWPRGVSRERLKIDVWLRDLAPSTTLRHWFGHDPSRWSEFRQRFREELNSTERSATLDELAERSNHEIVTLIYGARDEEHNQAIVLRDVLAERGASDKR